ncbi:MAG: ABC transporter substrate-binding protein [Nitrososphaerales archaeon]
MKYALRALPLLLILGFVLSACAPAATPAAPAAPAATQAPAAPAATEAATAAPAATEAPAGAAPAATEAPAAAQATTAPAASPAAASPAIALPTPSKPIPPGKMITWAFGQPKFLQEWNENFLARHPEIQGVTSEMVTTTGEEEVRQKTMLAFTSQSFDEMADVISTFPVSMQAMADAGMLVDNTDFLTPLKDQFVAGAYDQIVYKGKLYCLPRSLRPQLLFYNKDIFDQYGIDPSQMKTFEGYLEVGRQLKQKSNGEVFLSYEDPATRTWRYWGRRGLMPQAGAKIWDDQGNVVIDTDPGSLKAFKYFETLHKEGLLYNSKILEPPLYEATRQGKVATYYIGAFYDEFLKANLKDMAGKWRVMEAPVFQDLNLGGAPVVDIQCLPNKPGQPYVDLARQIWYDYNFNSPARQAYTENVIKENGPVQNPLSKAMLAEPFWQEPDPYYGGQSFRQMEGQGLKNVSQNLRVTTKDAEADTIISAELEKFVANAQTMDEAIANMAKNLKDKIGQAPPNPEQ